MAAWPSLTGRLLSISRPRAPELGNCKRQLASVFVWVHVTSGEPAFAPRPIDAAQTPEVQKSWRRSWNQNWWLLLTSNKTGSVHNDLRTELDALATTLAATIDPSPSGDSSLGTVPLYTSRQPRRPRTPGTDTK